MIAGVMSYRFVTSDLLQPSFFKVDPCESAMTRALLFGP